MAGLASGPWADGDTSRILGDLRLAQGDLDGAEAALRRAHERGWESQPGLAMLQAARGEPDAAIRGLGRALAEGHWALRQRRALLLAREGDPAAARLELDAAQAAFEALQTPAHVAQCGRLRAGWLDGVIEYPRLRGRRSRTP